METEENEVLVRRVFDEVFNDGRLEVADEIYHSKCEFHDPPPGFEGLTGPSLVKGACVAFGEAFPDHRYQVDEMLSVDDRVIVRWSVRATHKKTLRLGPLEVPATDGSVHVRGMSIVRCEDRQIQEVWQVVDMSAISPLQSHQS